MPQLLLKARSFQIVTRDVRFGARTLSTTHAEFQDVCD